MLPQFDVPFIQPVTAAVDASDIVEYSGVGTSIEHSMASALAQAEQSGFKKILIQIGPDSSKINYGEIISFVEAFPRDTSLALVVDKLEKSLLNPYKFIETVGQNRWKRIKVFDHKDSALAWL